MILVRLLLILRRWIWRMVWLSRLMVNRWVVLIVVILLVSVTLIIRATWCSIVM